jgi:hypothetical protein
VWLLLCNSTDRSALWAASRLRARGFEPLTVLTPELLHYSFHWEHRLGRDGVSSVALTLADGRRIVEGLCGAWRHRSEWAWLAGQAGFDVDDYLQQVPPAATPPETGGEALPVRTIIAVDGQGIGGHLDEGVADACGRLGVLAKTRILGVDLDARTSAFVSASPLPDLRTGGEPFIDALASALRGVA